MSDAERLGPVAPAAEEPRPAPAPGPGAEKQQQAEKQQAGQQQEPAEAGSPGSPENSGSRRAEESATGGAEEPEWDPFAEAGRSPLGSAGRNGGAGTARAARANFAARTAATARNTAARTADRIIDVGGDSQYYEGNLFLTQIGRPAAGPARVDGPVPEEELERLSDCYLEVPGYQRMKSVLRDRGLLALCGEPGSSRTATALALLAELTGNRVVRLDPDTALHQITEEDIKPEHGYVLEPSPRWEERAEHRPAGADSAEGAPARPPAQLHLDRLSALLLAAGAYAVLVAGGGEPAARLLRGRYGMPCTPPPAQQVLHRHLRVLLRELPAGSLPAALAHAERADVADALGLDELRPGEAAGLAGLLARRQRGELMDEDFLEACGTFVRAQARDWFAGADRPGTLPAALPSLGTAAFRMALAVLNGSAYSLTAEVGEQLARNMALALDPEQEPGQRLFAVHAEDRPPLARAVVTDGELDFGEVRVPARVIRFRGDRLATAVLHEVWHGYPGARRPVSSWLRELCGDPRPELWVRASVAAGVLCSWDWGHGYGELVLPMAVADSPLLRMAAATALAEAAREPAVQPAVRSLLREWAQGGAEHPRATAVLTHGYGMAAGSVAASLDELGKLARPDHPRLLPVIAHSVLRLLAGTEPETVLRRLGDWLRSGRREYADVVLLTVLGALRTRTTFLWGLNDVPALEPYASRPLIAALLSARPEQALRIADLVGHALATARSGEAALDALGGWLRQASDSGDSGGGDTVGGDGGGTHGDGGTHGGGGGDGGGGTHGDGGGAGSGGTHGGGGGDGGGGTHGGGGGDGGGGTHDDGGTHSDHMAVVCGFLPLLAESGRDRDRLRHLLARLVRDVDDPLDKAVARRMWAAVESAEGAE